VCHVSDPRGNSLGYFCPSRASSQCFSQASGASRSQHRLSSFLLTKDAPRGCNAVGCANTNEHRPMNTRNSFSAPEAVLSEVEQRFDCVQAQTHMYPSLVEFFILILNRIPLLQVQSHTHSPIGCFHPPRSCEPRPTRMKKEMKEATKQGKS
jgi:hypothetical protein